MTIANRDEVRRLAGNPLPTRVPDDIIDGEIETSDTFVKLYTFKEDWNNTNMEWPALKKASELIAASYIRQMFRESGSKETVSDAQYKEGINTLELINRKSGTAGQRSVVIKHRPYKTPALNPESGLYYSSIHKKDFIVGGGGVEGIETLSEEPWR